MAQAAKTPRLHPGSEQEPAASRSALVTIQAGDGASRPLFCVHAEAGDVSLYYNLARHLAPEQPVLGLCAPAPGALGAHPRLEQMAALHVREIRDAQPAGPYLIAGECTGGALAYEIARQLRSAGQEVALLALIDAFPSGLPLSPRMPKPAYRIVHRARILAFHLANLFRLRMGAKLAYASAKARRAREALTGTVSSALRRPAASRSPQLAFRRALAAYDPRPYPGSVVVFRAARLPLGIQTTPDLGWGHLAERVEVETIPGYFTTPISEPAVRLLAERLARHLAQPGGRDPQVTRAESV